MSALEPVEARILHVLVGVTGSVAAIKVPELVQQLTELKDPKVSL